MNEIACKRFVLSLHMFYMALFSSFSLIPPVCCKYFCEYRLHESAWITWIKLLYALREHCLATFAYFYMLWPSGPPASLNARTHAQIAEMTNCCLNHERDNLDAFKNERKIALPQNMEWNRVRNIKRINCKLMQNAQRNFHHCYYFSLLLVVVEMKIEKKTGHRNAHQIMRANKAFGKNWCKFSTDQNACLENPKSGRKK